MKVKDKQSARSIPSPAEDWISVAPDAIHEIDPDLPFGGSWLEPHTPAVIGSSFNNPHSMGIWIDWEGLQEELKTRVIAWLPSPRLIEPNIEERPYSERIKAVNRYFKLKAADVFGDEQSVRLLARLYEADSASYEDLDIDEYAKAFAKLAAAGFCELGANKLQITDNGRKFIESIEQS